MTGSSIRKASLIAVALFAALIPMGCTTNGNGGGGDGDGDVNAKAIPAANMTYVAFAWNDLGMHCLNPTYDKAVILPPYNTVWVQVVKRGDPPEIVTAGLTVEYAIRGNTYSYGKRSYGQFWDNMPLLFGVVAAPRPGPEPRGPGHPQRPRRHDGRQGRPLPGQRHPGRARQRRRGL